MLFKPIHAYSCNQPQFIRWRDIHLICLYVYSNRHRAYFCSRSLLQVIPSVIHIRHSFILHEALSLKFTLAFLWIIITQLIIHSHSVLEYNIHTFIMRTQVHVHYADLVIIISLNYSLGNFAAIFSSLAHEKHFLFYPWIPQRPWSIFMVIVHCVQKKRKERKPEPVVAFADTREFSIVTNRDEPPKTTTALVPADGREEPSHRSNPTNNEPRVAMRTAEKGAFHAEAARGKLPFSAVQY